MVKTPAHSLLSPRRSLRRRRGPVALADDSWDDTVAPPRPPVEPRRTGRHTWVIVAVGAAWIIALVRWPQCSPVSWAGPRPGGGIIASGRSCAGRAGNGGGALDARGDLVEPLRSGGYCRWHPGRRPVRLRLWVGLRLWSGSGSGSGSDRGRAPGRRPSGPPPRRRSRSRPRRRPAPGRPRLARTGRRPGGPRRRRGRLGRRRRAGHADVHVGEPAVGRHLAPDDLLHGRRPDRTPARDGGGLRRRSARSVVRRLRPRVRDPDAGPDPVAGPHTVTISNPTGIAPSIDAPSSFALLPLP